MLSKVPSPTSTIEGKNQYSRDAYSAVSAIFRGFKRNCPHCGQGAIFKGYLKLHANCSSCNAPTGDIKADDFPPYLTIFLVGHIIIPLLIYVEVAYQPPIWLQMSVWPILSIVLSLAFLPFIKGSVVGLMWYLSMKGDEQH